ncbi:MAG: 3-deoxy-manno-octulosonate cytidylyltransferase [Deltaproteobacteria bacterium]|nr:3-deoxy-manno-octulosonate cytidylyltransferase [Deltaproteobacteria bacterium]
MRAVVVIPARFSSTRLNGKPLADIGGKPMIQRVHERALSASLAGEVIVATDDERILRAVEAFGGRAVMTSDRHASGTDRIAEAVEKLKIKAGIIVNVQGDEPLIEAAAIDDAIRPMLERPELKVCTLKTRITDEHDYLDPNAVKVVTDEDGNALYFSRSPIPNYNTSFKEAAPRLFKHIGLYVYRRDFLLEFSGMRRGPLEKSERLEQLRILENGHRIRVVETPYNPVSVDTPEDLERVREIVRKWPFVSAAGD